MGSFGSIAGAETALTREFGRHVFEIAALLRVSHTLYNYRVLVVETKGTELATPHPVIEPVSALESGTEFFDAETGGRNGLIRGDCVRRDRANLRIWQTCL